MNVDDVRGRIDSLVDLMNEERKLRVELLGLELMGPSGAVRVARERHDEIIAEITDLRERRMVGVMRDLARFVKVKIAQGPPDWW